MSKISLAVFFGGNSNEHDISVITGMLAVNLLRETYDVLPVYLPREGGMAVGKELYSVADFRVDTRKKLTPVYLRGQTLVTAKGKPLKHIDCALNCCHGGMGEDGTLSALFRWNGVKSASPEMPVSAAFMDKVLTKIAAAGLGIPVAKWACVREGERFTELPTSFPVIVKPARLGSSIGISVARNIEELEKALALAFRLDDSALIEEYFQDRRDLNCAARSSGAGFEVSEVEEVFSHGEILSFSEKYEGTGARTSQIPAEIPQKTTKRAKEYTRRIAEQFGVRGVVRADFLLVGDTLYFNELNTVPGSLACYLFGESLTQSKEFLISLIEDALARREQKKEVLTTGILERGVFAGGKGSKRRG